MSSRIKTPKHAHQLFVVLVATLVTMHMVPLIICCCTGAWHGYGTVMEMMLLPAFSVYSGPVLIFNAVDDYEHNERWHTPPRSEG